MRHKRLKLSTMLLLGLGLTGLQAQTVDVNERNGTQTAYSMSSIRKMYFSEGHLIITKTDHHSEVYALNGLWYLNFSDLTIGLDELLDIQDRLIIPYPNPVANLLNIDLNGVANPEGTISIISLEGKTIMNRIVTSGGIISVDLSQLSEGIYICRYSNSAETRTAKIIKQ